MKRMVFRKMELGELIRMINRIHRIYSFHMEEDNKKIVLTLRDNLTETKRQRIIELLGNLGYILVEEEERK